MRNKNAQNNGKDGEYGEGKNEKEKRKRLRKQSFLFMELQFHRGIENRSLLLRRWLLR